MYQITNANNINSKRLAGYLKNKYKNIVYKNYNNSKINIARLKSVNTIIDSKIWDIVDRVLNSLKKTSNIFRD